MRRLEASTLVDSHVYEHRSRLHQLQHIFCDKLRSSITGYEHRADDNIYVAKLAADIVLG